MASIKNGDGQGLLKAVGYRMGGRDYFCKEARNHIINRFSLAEEYHTRLTVANPVFNAGEVGLIRLLCKEMNACEIDTVLGLAERR